MEKFILMIKSFFFKKCDACGEPETKDDPFLTDNSGLIAHKSCWIEMSVEKEKVEFKSQLELKDIQRRIYEIEADRLRHENHEMMQFIYVLVSLAGGKVSVPSIELIAADGCNFEVSQDIKNQAIILSIKNK